MYQGQQASYTSVSYYSLETISSSIPNRNPNPNPNANFRSPVYSLSSSHVPQLHPPEIDPYVSSSYPSVYGGAGVQSAYYHDPNGVSQSWGVQPAAPVQYPSAIKSLNAAGAPSVSYVPPSSSNFRKPTVNSVPKQTLRPHKKVLKQKKVSQAVPVRCELCNVECNDLHVYEKHLSGRKHRIALQRKYAPNPAPLHPTHGPVAGGNTSGQVRVVGGPMVANVASDNSLETKKRKLAEEGTAPDAVRVCTICNIVCNSEIVFAAHLSGKKHAAQAALQGASVTGPPVGPTINSDTKKQDPNQIKKTRTAWCKVCKIHCSSSDDLKSHKLGKKHKKNLKKQKRSATKPSSGEVENPPASNVTADNSSPPKKKVARIEEVDLETKKRKIMEAGVAADAVRMCTICNVVCNSETVFNSHLAGQKHAAMVKEAEDKKVSDAS